MGDDMLIELDMVQSVAIAVIVLLIGKLLVRKFEVLRKYCIPEPVVGGFLFAILHLILRQVNIVQIGMDTTLQDFMMTIFFTSVGFSASLKLLKKGGFKVFLFLVAAVGLVILQNIVGASLATILNLDPLLGMATGSIPMTGGHGTAAAFGPELERLGAVNANTVALAAATFGLVSGSMIGGPTGNRLITKFNLSYNRNDTRVGIEEVDLLEDEQPISLNQTSLSLGIFEILIAMGFGTIISAFFVSIDITLPGYIGAMLIGALIRNISDTTKWFDTPMVEIDSIGSISLSIFLSMALMGLRLWELADLAIPLFIMLFAQVLLVFLYANFVTFRVLGKDYDAAVMAAGHCGFGLGATPNGIANMTSVVGKFGISPTAFFVLPLVGALFIDFVNSATIVFFVNLFS